MRKIIFIFLLITVPHFAQSTLTSLNMKAGNGVAFIMPQKTLLNDDFTELMTELQKLRYQISSVDGDLNLSLLNSQNSPFVRDVNYVLRVSILNELVDSILSIQIELLDLKSTKILTREIGVPRTSFKNISKDIDTMLQQLIPQIENKALLVDNVQKSRFSFTNNLRGLRKGDEIRVQYRLPRKGFTESPSIVMSVSSNEIIARDLMGFVEINDTVVPTSPKRNRFSLNVHAMFPALGDPYLRGTLEGENWTSNTKRWPAGFSLEAEYERFLPYQLVSTTVLGIDVDGALGTHLMTGLGYRGLWGSWEFMPYLRFGFMYNPLSFKSPSNSDPMQGLTIRVGMDVGMNIMNRITDDIFIGIDFGLRWYFHDFVVLQTAGEKVQPSWSQNKFPLSQFYPYLGFKVGWIF
ncbi:MAG: hypothetical protein ACRCS8_04065 [Brevinema sp.]